MIERPDQPMVLPKRDTLSRKRLALATDKNTSEMYRIRHGHFTVAQKRTDANYRKDRLHLAVTGPRTGKLELKMTFLISEVPATVKASKSSAACTTDAAPDTPSDSRRDILANTLLSNKKSGFHWTRSRCTHCNAKHSESFA
jgi:hypothetical protein